jgi:hypothetical protein
MCFGIVNVVAAATATDDDDKTSTSSNVNATSIAVLLLLLLLIFYVGKEPIPYLEMKEPALAMTSPIVVDRGGWGDAR